MEEELRRVLIDGAQQVHRAIGKMPRRLLQAIDENGATEAVRRLLDAKQPSETFADLWPSHAELTIEAIALRPQFQNLFTDAQLRTARRRLGRE